MSDLISRQNAIKAIKDLPNCPNGYSDTYDKARIIGVIEDLPSAQQWIPYSERLPEEEDMYLVTGITKDGYRFRDTVSMHFNRWTGYGDTMSKPDVVWETFEDTDTVIAWMPLPEPYKEDDR